ncbi:MULTISPECIES: helix-turn-helix domain-containing protein [Streptomyces]|uniref:XRE family transcriptional regulator n=1 Tax=Streptomyces prasinus TaxID=67345 RepID=A0ABX6B5B4_9ACTN|nr:helix-turn-helix transcriptional regulator [Streptomyces prasinus]QEV09055.1 XRE family transcriptional regulator [Streptomyces prasinus]
MTSRARSAQRVCGVKVSAQDDVAEFAARLRELKERTDRSYGSLARRLGMNTSTLHRYCAGGAVPLDFAPVERFAALCGASGAERLELHRHWLLAVAARQRPRAGETAGTGTARAAETGAGSEAKGEPGAEAVPEPKAVPEAETRAVAEDAGTPSVSDATTGPGTGTGIGRPLLDADVVIGPRPPAGRPLPRPWYRRKRVAGVLAVACASLVTAGTLAALPDGHRSAPDGRVRATADSVPTASADPTAPGPPASPPPASPPSGRPERTPGGPGTGRGPSGPAASGDTSGNAGGTGSEDPSGTSSGGSSGASSGPAGTPLAWTVDSQAWAFGCGHDYVVAKPPARVPPPPVPQDAGTWAATQAAVHGGETIVKLSVQGTSDTAVVLTALRVRVTGRTEPAPGNAYAMDQGCGGALTPRYFAVDLDKDRPIARAVAGNDAGTPIPAVRMPYRVSARDPEVLEVTATTAGCDCRWHLELDWSSGGRSGTARIDDGGRPFRTSGVEGLPRYEYDTSRRRWTPRAG